MKLDRSSGKPVLVSRLGLAPKGLHRQGDSPMLEEEH
jgi:hypothetical protein